MTQAKRYNYCLDFIKGIACICVVFMHCEFPGTLGIIIQTMSRFSVPFFFMVSGYFCFIQNGKYTDNSNIISKKVLHVFRITIYASLFYLCFVLFQHFVWHDQSFKIGISGWIKFLIFNKPFIVAGQYWFLFALVYTYIFFGIIDKLKLSKYAYRIAGLLFIVYFLMAQGAHMAGIRIPNFIYRNWLVEGFTYFMLGHWIHSIQDKVNLKSENLLLIIIFSTLLCLPERFLLGRDFGVNLCTVPQVFALFVFAVKSPEMNTGAIQQIGKNCSMLVYILHPFVWHSLERVYDKFELSDNIILQYSMPIIIVIVSLLIALGLNVVISYLKKRHLFTNIKLNMLYIKR